MTWAARALRVAQDARWHTGDGSPWQNRFEYHRTGATRALAPISMLPK